MSSICVACNIHYEEFFDLVSHVVQTTAGKVIEILFKENVKDGKHLYDYPGDLRL